MKGSILYTALLTISILQSMEKPPKTAVKKTTKKITKKELLELILKQNAKDVHFAILHRRAGKVIDHEIVQTAEEKKGDLNLSRSGSIYIMIKKATEQSAIKPTSVKSVSFEPHQRYSSKKPKELSPQELLRHLIKKKDLDGITEFAGTRGTRFIDKEAIDYARKKYESFVESSGIKVDPNTSKEFLILQFLKQYDSSSYKQRRKSCTIKPHSLKETQP